MSTETAESPSITLHGWTPNPSVLLGQVAGGKKNLRQTRMLQDLVFATAFQESAKPADRARLAIAFDKLEDRKRIIAGRPLPGILHSKPSASERANGRKSPRSQVQAAPSSIPAPVEPAIEQDLLPADDPLARDVEHTDPEILELRSKMRARIARLREQKSPTAAPINGKEAV